MIVGAAYLAYRKYRRDQEEQENIRNSLGVGGGGGSAGGTGGGGNLELQQQQRQQQQQQRRPQEPNEIGNETSSGGGNNSSRRDRTSGRRLSTDSWFSELPRPIQEVALPFQEAARNCYGGPDSPSEKKETEGEPQQQQEHRYPIQYSLSHRQGDLGMTDRGGQKQHQQLERNWPNNKNNNKKAARIIEQYMHNDLQRKQNLNLDEDDEDGDGDTLAIIPPPPSAPLPSNNNNNDNNITPLQLTTFRNDVRKEWIQAVFGRDFPRNYNAFDSDGKNINNNNINNNNDDDVLLHVSQSLKPLQRQQQSILSTPWQGVGLAKVAPYTAYTVEIPPNLTSSTEDVGSTIEEKKDPGHRGDGGKLGITLSRLALGLYVRTVQPGSEAWCAGIQPNSVLVSINSINLLAEPSKAALERIWQYEGYGFARGSDFVMTAGPNRYPQNHHYLSTTTTTTLSNENSSANGQTPSSSTTSSTTATTHTSMMVQEPISMTFILKGRLYSVILLSNPPYGIDWAPCGNFCVIKKVHSQRAIAAGVQTTSLVASINDRHSIFDLDHITAGAILKDLAANGHETIRLQLCFPPSAARSGHWERQQDALVESKNQSTNDSNSQGNTSNKDMKPRTSVSSRRREQPPPPPRFTAHLDGVQVKIHPLLGGGPPRRGTSQQPTSSLVGYVSPTSSLSQLAARVASGEVLPLSIRQYNNNNNNNNSNNNRIHVNHPSCNNNYSNRNDDNSCHSCQRYLDNMTRTPSSSSSSPSIQQQHHHLERRIYRPCPSIDTSILEHWDSEQSLLYLLKYHGVNYNEEELDIGYCYSSHDSDDQWNNDDQVIYTTKKSNMLVETLFQQHDNTLMGGTTHHQHQQQQVPSAISTFLLFWMAWLTNNDNEPFDLTQRLLEVAKDDLSLAYPMEFVAGALENEDIKKSLSNLRAYRQEQQQQPKSQVVNGRDLTATTSPKDYNMPMKNSKAGSNRRGDGESSQLSGSTDPSTTVQIESSTTKSKQLPAGAKASNRGMFQIFRKMKKSNSKRRQHAHATSTLNQDVNQNLSSELRSPSSVKELPSISLLGSKEDYSTSPRGKNSLVSPAREMQRSTHPATVRNTPAEPTKDTLFANTLLFLEELEMVCLEIEKSLMHTFSQKFARWALQPWTPNKETALAQVTHAMRERLKRCNQAETIVPLLNPVNPSSPPLLSIDTNGCYILPSAHFPLLLTFDCPTSRMIKDQTLQQVRNNVNAMQTSSSSSIFGEERVYRTIIELVELRGSRPTTKTNGGGGGGGGGISPRRFSVHASVAGLVVESERSTGIDRHSNRHVWDTGNILVFDSRSTWGPPMTLSLRLSEVSLDSDGKEQITSADVKSGKLSYEKECGYCWVDLSPYWKEKPSTNTDRGTCSAAVVPSNMFEEFDEHGDLIERTLFSFEPIEIEVRVTSKIVESGGTMKRSLLYKHDDDVRQEMFAVEFVKSCDRILRCCGLDMKMLTFLCVPVGRRRGFIEWVQGSVPLSEICQPFAGSILAKTGQQSRSKHQQGRQDTKREDNESSMMMIDDVQSDVDGEDDCTLSSVARAGLTKYESLNRIDSGSKTSSNTALPTNPIQDFLRSFAYDAESPYKIKRGVMDTYVKSCAGYTVCSFLLGVGDRHLDNLLLHPSGHFFHCDYSFILGNDPKKYLPMRITDDMVNGMGGWKSDNFCQFLSLTCAVYLTLRRPENVRHLLSLVRLMEGCGLPDLEETQSLETAIRGLRDRMRLDLNDEEAITFMEKLIEDSCSSKMWIAVDAIHSLARRF